MGGRDERRSCVCVFVCVLIFFFFCSWAGGGFIAVRASCVVRCALSRRPGDGLSGGVAVGERCGRPPEPRRVRVPPGRPPKARGVWHPVYGSGTKQRVRARDGVVKRTPAFQVPD